MKSSSFEQVIQAQFDCLTKKVIKRAAIKYNRDISRRLKHEVPFSEISNLEQVIAKHIPKTCVKEINVLSYRYFNAENKKHLILGTTNKPHLAMKLVSPMQ